MGRESALTSPCRRLPPCRASLGRLWVWALPGVTAYTPNIMPVLKFLDLSILNILV